jgi:hypothetical protein
MPALSDHQSNQTTKLLLIGDSGMGKTGALASLARAGYNLYIVDYDNGLDILANVLRNEPEALARVQFETITDKTRISNGVMIPEGKAWSNGLRQIDKFLNGPCKGPRDVFVLDSLNFAGRAAIRFVLSLNGRITDVPRWDDYYTAQGLQDRLLAALYSDSVGCNVVVLSHVREIAKTHTEVDSKGRAITVEEEGSRKGYAETGTGKALSPAVGRYFNALLLADIEGSGPNARRLIRTVPHGNIGLKNSSPTKVKPSYPLTTGLAEYFAEVRGESK